MKIRPRIARVVGFVILSAMTSAPALGQEVQPSPFHRMQDGNGRTIPCQCWIGGQLVQLGPLHAWIRRKAGRCRDVRSLRTSRRGFPRASHARCHFSIGNTASHDAKRHRRTDLLLPLRATSSCHRCRSKAGWRGREALSGCAYSVSQDAKQSVG
jgi:hypothetical protein